MEKAGIKNRCPVPGSMLKRRYRIDRKLGRGGQGTVYLCRDLDVYNQKRAIKQLVNVSRLPEAERKTALSMFDREGAFLSRLNHPGLPRISDKFTEDGHCYLVIDFVEGRNLEQILAEQPDFFTEERVHLIALQLCDILHYMHSQDPPVVFRDLKPENIILTREGQVKLIDFGIARLYDRKKKNDTIQVGTVGYAAPEQYSGSTDPRSDIYAFGALFHHLLTGLDPKKMAPFEAERITVRSVNPAVSTGTEQVIRKALAGNRNRRFRNVGEMRTAILASGIIIVCPGCGTLLTHSEETCNTCGRRNRDSGKKEHRQTRFFLQPKQGPGRGLLLEERTLYLGRLADNDLVVNDPGASGRHAVIESTGKKHWISDLGSTNGTWADGKRVRRKKIKPGMQLRIGRTEYTVTQV